MLIAWQKKNNNNDKESWKLHDIQMQSVRLPGLSDFKAIHNKVGHMSN